MLRGHSSRVQATLAVALVLLMLAVGAAAPPKAAAHALLVQSDPGVNARLLDVPVRITAGFTEPLNSALSFIEVLDGQGGRVHDGETRFSMENDREMSVGLRPDLEPGFYVVVWETLSDLDGHLLRGSFPFTILNPDGSEPSGPRFTGVDIGFSGGEPTAGPVVTKWLLYVAAFLLTGGVAYSLVVTPATSAGSAAAAASRRFVFIAAGGAVATLLVVGVAELLVQANQIGGLSRLGDALDTAWGERWWQRELAAAVAGVALAGAFVWQRSGREGLSRGAEALVLAAGLGYLFLLSTISHGASVDGSFWAIAADFIHLIAAAVWIGMLVQLALVIRWSRSAIDAGENAGVAALYVQRFSAVAAASLLLLLATGTFNAFVQVEPIRGLIDTGYGLTLVAKLALLLPLLALAAVNAVIVKPALLNEARKAGAGATDAIKRRLGRLIAAESAVAVGVLVITAVLVQFPTARQEAEAAGFAESGAEAVVGYEETEPAGDLSINVSIAPNTVGNNSFQVFIFPPAGEELSEILRARIRFKPPDPTLGPSQVIAQQEAPNFFRAVGAFFTQPGDWEMEVDLRRRGEVDVSAFFAVPVAGAAGVAVDDMALPLVAGSWSIVAAVGVFLIGLMLWLGVSQWPTLPESLRGSLRVIQSTATTLGVGLIALAAFGLLDFSDKPAAANPIATTGRSIAIGRSVYFQQCAVCHGEDGRGDGPAAATLPIQPADFRIHVPFHSDQFFFLVMSNGFGSAMPAFADRVSEDERWHILNYLQALYGLDAQAEEGSDNDG